MADLLAEPTPEISTPPVEVPVAETNVEADERAYEQLPESKETFLEQENGATTAIPIPVSRASGQAPAAGGATGAKDEVTVRVEKILEEGLGPLYASLPDEAKPLFKKKGEEAATQISVMARSLKLEVSKVIRLIRDWLLTIPKVNRFFLEQEAKIKTDALVEYVEARKEDLMKQP